MNNVKNKKIDFDEEQEKTIDHFGKYSDVLLFPNLKIPNLVKQPFIDILPYGSINSIETPYSKDHQAKK